MRYIFGVSVLFFCMVQGATASVLSEPDNSFILLDIDEPTASETYYGVLDNFPHTYQFRVPEGEEVMFSAQVSVLAEGFVYKPSLILVKEEKRGVSEIDRKSSKDIQWKKYYDTTLAMTLSEGELLEAALSEGVYKLEVSTAENLKGYRLEVNGGARSSYRELFMARSVFGTGWISLFFAWRIFIPLLLIGGFWYWRKRQKTHV